MEKYLKLLEDGIEEEANNQKTLNENKKEEFIVSVVVNSTICVTDLLNTIANAHYQPILLYFLL